MKTGDQDEINMFGKFLDLGGRIFVFLFNLVLGLFFLSLVASLFFHFVFANIENRDIFNTPVKETIENISSFPKENISFSNTFIFQDDINKLIKRYNEASILEKVSIRQEPLTRKLMEKGFIKEK